MLGRIIHIVNIFSTINIFKTVCFSYKVFPWIIAENLPVFVGWTLIYISGIDAVWDFWKVSK